MQEVRKTFKHQYSQSVNGGNVTTVEKHFSVKATVEQFVMIFPEQFAKIYEIGSSMDIKIFLILASKCGYNTNKMSLTAVERKEIINSLAIVQKTFTNSISRLKAAGLITGSYGSYEINPYVAWKGTTDARRKLIKEIKLNSPLIEDIFNKDNNYGEQTIIEQSGDTGSSGEVKEQPRDIQELGVQTQVD